jgi:hypothetical protein
LRKRKLCHGPENGLAVDFIVLMPPPIFIFWLFQGFQWFALESLARCAEIMRLP